MTDKKNYSIISQLFLSGSIQKIEMTTKAMYFWIREINNIID